MNPNHFDEGQDRPMDNKTLQLITRYVNDNIDIFHNSRLNKVHQLQLNDVLKRKNPYLFRAKNITSAPDLVSSILDAFLSSSEEELFGKFLEGLAIYVSEITCGGHKSAAPGIDLELTRDRTRYIVAVKSGPNWGNSQQYTALRLNFKNAVKVLKQSRRMLAVQPVLGICYGRFRTVNTGEYLKIGGQSFWHFISGNHQLYIDIIQPLGYEAKKHNDRYLVEKNLTYNRFARDFMNDFCDRSGRIDWPKLVQFNSGNLDS